MGCNKDGGGGGGGASSSRPSTYSSGGGGGGFSGGGSSAPSTPPSVSTDFYDSSHGVDAYKENNVDLRHPRDEYSHAMTRHAPDGNIAGKSEFDTHGEIHEVRKKWIDEHAAALSPVEGNRVFKDVKHNGNTYLFGVEYRDGRWHEITGYPKKK